MNDDRSPAVADDGTRTDEADVSMVSVSPLSRAPDTPYLPTKPLQRCYDNFSQRRGIWTDWDLIPYLKASFNIFGSQNLWNLECQYNTIKWWLKTNYISLHTFSIKMQFYVVSPDFYENNTKTFFPGPRCASSNWIVDVSPERRYADSPPMHNLNFSLRQLIQSPAATAPAWAGERSGDTR